VSRESPTSRNTCVPSDSNASKSAMCLRPDSPVEP
jgi:hypothetical protein